MPYRLRNSFRGVEGSDLAIALLEAGEEGRSSDRGLQAEDGEEVEVDKRTRRSPKWRMKAKKVHKSLSRLGFHIECSGGR